MSSTTHRLSSGVIDASLLDVHGERWNDDVSREQAGAEFEKSLRDSEAKEIWGRPLPGGDAIKAAEALGFLQARLQQVAALEMIAAQQAGDIELAREWRSVIQMPKFANSVEGALALQRLGGEATHRVEVGKLLAREFAIWQLTRAREKMDALTRLIRDGRSSPTLIARARRRFRGWPKFRRRFSRWRLVRELSLRLIAPRSRECWPPCGIPPKPSPRGG